MICFNRKWKSYEIRHGTRDASGFDFACHFRILESAKIGVYVNRIRSAYRWIWRVKSKIWSAGTLVLVPIASWQVKFS